MRIKLWALISHTMLPISRATISGDYVTHIKRAFIWPPIVPATAVPGLPCALYKRPNSDTGVSLENYK